MTPPAARKPPNSDANPSRPRPWHALMLGVTGDLLGQSVPLLAFYDIGPSEVRILGPATWARDAARLPNLAGAWYAAPDPALRAGFNQQYSAAYNQPPRDYASIAFDRRRHLPRHRHAGMASRSEP